MLSTVFRQISYCVRISRPLNVFIAFISVWIAGLLSPNFNFNITLVYASLTVALIAAGGNIVNDIFDLEIDKINKPDRLLPSGALSITSAWTIYILFNIWGLIFALLSGQLFLIIAFCTAALLFLYSSRLKKTVLLGNIAVSLSGAAVFIYGALSVNDWQAGVIPAVFAFLFHLGREVVKDMQDLEGDLQHNAVTFAGRFGKKNSIILINFIFLLLTSVTILPYIFLVYNKVYLFVVVIGVDLIIIAVSVLLWFRNDVKALGVVSHLLKLDMFIGLMAVYIGSNNVIFFN